MTQRTCKACPSDISHRHAQTVYCSQACRSWFDRHGTPRTREFPNCLECGKSLLHRMISARYCTVLCKTRAVEKRRERDDAARYLREREHRIAYATRYAKENPHVGQATKRKRRAAQAGAGSHQFTSADWLRLQRRHNFCCVYCGERRRLTMDHVVPLVRGGTHSIGNILPACLSCNCRKQGRFVMEWKLNRSRKIGWR